MKKEDILLSCGEYGFGRFAFYDYRFLVSNDYQCMIDLSMRKELVEKHISTESVSLTRDEILKVRDICKELASYRVIGEKEGNRYDGFSVSLYQDGGEIVLVRDNVSFQKQVESLRKEVQENHEELSSKKIAELYYRLTDEVYHTTGVPDSASNLENRKKVF